MYVLNEIIKTLFQEEAVLDKTTSIYRKITACTNHSKNI